MQTTKTYVSRRSLAAAALLTAGLVTGCSSTPQTPALSADVWARVDGRDIRKDDVEKAYRGAMRTDAPTPSDEEAMALKLNILDELITQNLLTARAGALKVQVTDTEIDNALAEQKGTMADEAFQQELKRRNLTVDDIKAGLRRQLTTQKVLDAEVVSKVNVTDEEVTAYFNANRPQFNFPEPQYRLAQIVVTGQRDAQINNRRNDDATTPEQAQSKMAMLAGRLKSGETFSSVAMDYSEDPNTAAQGGDLGLVGESNIKGAPPALRDAVLNMKPGQVSTVTQGPTLTMLMLIAREPAGQRDLSTPTVKEGIRDVLKSRRQQVLQVSYLASLRNGVAVVNNLAQQLVQAGGKDPNAVPPLPMSK